MLTSTLFSESPIPVISQLIRERSLIAVEDHRRLEAMLNDKCAKCPDENFLLSSAVRIKLHRKLLEYSGKLESKFDDLTRLVRQGLHFDLPTAQWLVTSWARALNLSLPAHLHRLTTSTPKETSRTGAREHRDFQKFFLFDFGCFT